MPSGASAPPVCTLRCCTCQVEGDDALVAEADRRLGDAEGDFGLVVAERAVDHAGDHAEVLLAALEARAARPRWPRRARGPPCAELGAVAHLQVAEMVARRILAHLVRHALDGLGRLQHRDRGVELLQEFLEVVGVIHQHEAADRLGIARGEGGAGIARELDQRLGAGATRRGAHGARPWAIARSTRE